MVVHNSHTYNSLFVKSRFKFYPDFNFVMNSNIIPTYK